MKTALLFFLLVVSTTVFAQKAPAIQWQKSYGGSRDDFSNSIRQTADGGYVTAGSTKSSDGDVTGRHGFLDVWVLKLDSVGGIQWQKCLGGSQDEEARSIQQTTDGGFIVAGYSYSNDKDVSGHHGTANGSDIWVVKLSNNGNIQWQKSLGGSNSEDVNSIQQTSDGGYILAGYTWSLDGDIVIDSPLLFGGRKPWIIKLNSTGNIEWNKRFNYETTFYSMQQTIDGGYVASSTQESSIFKFSSTGHIEWQNSFANIFSNSSNTSVIQTRDTGYFVVGYSRNVYESGTIIKLNSSGSLLWQKAMPIGTMPGFIEQTIDSGFILSSSKYTIVTGGKTNSNYLAVKLNSVGDIQWQKTLGGIDDDLAGRISQTKEGGFIITGSAKSSDGDATFNHGRYDFWIVKLSSDFAAYIYTGTGNTACTNTPVKFTATTNKNSAVYQWIKNNVNVGTNNATYTDSLLQTGDSVACIITANGIADTSNYIKISIYQNYQPGIIIAGLSKFCAGTTATFKATVTNAGPQYQLQWKRNNINVGKDSSAYVDSTLQDGDSVWCVVTVKNKSCRINPSVASNQIKMTVVANVQPSITITSTPATYRFCSTAPAVALTFHASIKNGGGAPFYQWKKNNINVGTNSPYYADSLHNGDSIWCVLTSSAKCITTNNIVSNKIKITITAPVTPTVTVVPLPAGNICLHTPVRFKASIKNGGSAPHYQWKKNNVTVGTDSDTYNDSLLFNNDSVWCVFTSNAECAVNNPATSAKIKAVVTNAVPLKPSAISGPASVTANQQAIGYAVNLVSNVTYAWTVPAGCIIANGQGTNQIVVNWGTATGSIIVRAKNACGQSDSSKLLVRVVSSFGSGAVKGTEDALKTAGKEGVQLYPNPAVNTAYISFTAPVAGKYFIQVTDAQGRVLQTKETNAVKGANRLTVDVSRYAQGVYFIRLAGGNKQQSLRLLIQR